MHTISHYSTVIVPELVSSHRVAHDAQLVGRIFGLVAVEPVGEGAGAALTCTYSIYIEYILVYDI